MDYNEVGKIFNPLSDKIGLELNINKEQRDECGFKGHEWVCSDESMMSARAMCGLFTDHMNTALDKFEPKERYEVYKV